MSVMHPKPDSSDVLTYSPVRIVVFVLLVLAFLYFTGDGSLVPGSPPFPSESGVRKQRTYTLGIYVTGAWLIAFVRKNSREYSENHLVGLRVLGIVMAVLAIGWRIWLFPR